MERVVEEEEVEYLSKGIPLMIKKATRVAFNAIIVRSLGMSK